MSVFAGAFSTSCAIHRFHTPAIRVPGGYLVDKHHIQPRAEGGTDAAINIVVVCPTGHRRIHELMRALHRNGGVAPKAWWKWFGKTERALAQQGYDLTMLWRKANGVRIDLPLRDTPGDVAA